MNIQDYFPYKILNKILFLGNKMKSNFTEKINFDVVEEVVPGTKCSQKKILGTKMRYLDR
jgi:hypothetical protein